MTRMQATQRVNFVSAWAGAFIALALELEQKSFPWIRAAHPSGFIPVLATTIATLACLHYARLQGWTVTALCFLLGGLFTSISVSLVAWSSSIRW